MLCYLSTKKELDTLIENQKNFIVYKFNSKGCRISNRTIEYVEQAQRDEALKHIYFIDIIEHRDVSDYLVEKTTIHHESPQAIVFQGGEAISYTSHMHITKDWILEHSPFRGKA